MRTLIIALILFAIPFLASCQQTTSSDGVIIEEGMIKVTILYPNGEGKTFDMDYYANKHMPLVAKLLGDSMKHFAIDKGIAGGRPDAPLPFLAIGYLYFDKLADYQSSFGPNAEAILNDILNYTNSQPVVQISEIMH